MERVNRNQQHLLGLINGVLDFSTIEAQRVVYSMTVFSLAEVVAELDPMIEPQIYAKSIDYQIRDVQRFPVVAADRAKVQQILLNLLSNAIKFTEVGGKVGIEVLHSG